MNKPTERMSFGEYAGLVGETSLVEAPGLQGYGRIFAKAEWENPTGSIKDRAAIAMLAPIVAGHESGKPKPHILEYSGGNLGLSLALACYHLGYENTLFLSEAMPRFFIEELLELGSDIHLVDKDLGFWGVMEATRKYSVVHPHMTFLYQHGNYNNVNAHYEGTGKECVRQLMEQGVRPGEPLGLVSAIGTGGTLAGVLQALREAGYDPCTFGVTPSELPYGSMELPNGKAKFAGSGGLGNGRKQEFIADITSQIEDHLTYSYDESIAAKLVMFDMSGLGVGSSAAAAWLASLEVSKRLGPNGTVLTIFACQGLQNEWDAMTNPDVKTALSKIVENNFKLPVPKNATANAR